jgi:malate dehydrogenase
MSGRETAVDTTTTADWAISEAHGAQDALSWNGARGTRRGRRMSDANHVRWRRRGSVLSAATRCPDEEEAMESRDPRALRPVHVAVTGAAGQVGYALLYRIASGQLLGPDTPIVLRLMDIEPVLPALRGVAMELDDCAFPLLSDVVLTSSFDEVFDGASWALLVGAIPRKQGMERGDLLAVNGASFTEQGRAIGAHAATDVRVLVVGNPCNTNCLIARASAPDVPDDRWFAMTRLDENRAKAQLAQKAGVPVARVSNLAIWGNHSATQYPDAFNARIDGKPAPEVIGDDAWLRGDFITAIQGRGAAIIAARGLSSAGSAANAIIDSVHAIHEGTAPGDFTSLAVVSHGEYGVPAELVFGYPVVSEGTGWRVAEGIEHDAAAQARIQASTEELVAEREQVKALMPAH